MKQGNILKHFSVIGMGSLINMAIAFFTTPLLTRIVDPVEYGQYSIFILYANIATMVLCMGLDQSLVRFYYESAELKYRRALLWNCIKIPGIVSIVLALACSLLLATNIIAFEFPMLISILLCVFVVLQIIFRFSLLVVRLEYRSKLFALLNVLHKLLYIVTAIVLIIVNKSNNLLWLTVAVVFAELGCIIISILALKDNWKFSLVRSCDCMISMKDILSYGYPFIATLGITTLFQAIDKMSLNWYCSYREVGIYASACTIINIFAVVQTAFNSLWGPMAVEHYANDKEDRSFYQRGNSIITVVMFLIGLCLILFKDLIVMLLGEEYREAVNLLPFLIFNPIMYTISETTVSGLVFMKKSKLQIWAAVSACVSNFLGNITLIPIIGPQGAAISTGISYIVFFSVRTFLSNHYFYVDFKLKRFYLLTLVTILYAFCSIYVKSKLVIVAGFSLCIVVLFLLYRDVLKFSIKYILQLIKR